AVQRALAEQGTFSFQHRAVLPGGRVRWLHARGRVVLDAEGTAVGMVGTSQDVTERKRVDELRDTILSAVSHELRTPLTAIVGFATTLRERAGLAEELRAEMVDSLAEQARRLERLLSELLDLDRLRRGVVRPTFATTDVGRLVADVAAQHGSSHPIDV